MIAFFLIIGFIGGLALLGAHKSVEPKAKACHTNPDDRKHSWIIRFNNDDRKGYLVCKICGQIPGEE